MIHVLALYMAVAVYAHNGKAVLPDHRVTPGAVDHSITKTRLCSKTFRTRDERHVTDPMKKLVCLAYGIKSGCPGKNFEIDHVISIELGGAESELNLWPQPVDGEGVIGFHAKDAVENRAHAEVCRPGSTLTLEEAQEGIATDWYRFAKKWGFIE